MNKNWISEYCSSKNGVTTNFKKEWGWMRYYVADKMFAILAYDEAKEEILLTVRTDWEYSDQLQQQYQAIVPGYYCNKDLFTSIWFDVRKIPEKDRRYQADDIYPNQELIEEMIDHAYLICVKKLSKKKQEELLK